MEQTLDEVAYASRDSVARSPLLFVVLEGDRLMARGARYSLVGVDTVTLGRGAARLGTRSSDGRTLDVRIAAAWMSSTHAVIRNHAGEWIVEDAGSRNGTFVNGERITSRALRDGDLVEAGRVHFALRGAPGQEGPIVRDEDALRSMHPLGVRTLLPELREGYSALSRVARSNDVPILLLGPTGSGKELLARQVHAQSGRTGPFIPVNCGALPAMLVESLLFGHVKGAFSGAARDEIGFVRSADGGTLFLDEIGDLPPLSQAALLRVLQEREVIPVGASHAVKVDVRIVAATHRPLHSLSETGGFRSDLLARLKGYAHSLPSLRERMADFGVVLADVLASVAGARAERLSFTPEAARTLLAYRWPLNVRELQQAIATAVALAKEDAVDTCHLPAEMFPPAPAPVAVPAHSASDVLRDRVISLLYEQRGNVAAVARSMGKAPAQIHRWLHRFHIDPDNYRST